MKRLSVILFSVILLSIGFTARGEETKTFESLFYQGNSLYGEEKFKEAIAAYEEALNLGFESGPLYYNLANAYFKDGVLGKAIVNYLRAQRLMPDDADLKANLAYAQSLIKGGRITAEDNWLMRQLFALAGSLNLDTFTLATVSLYLLAALFTVLFIAIKRTRKLFGYLASLSLAGFLICACLFSIQFYNTAVFKKAVIIVKNSACKFEPFDDATTHFMLSEGECVIVGRAKNDWVKIKRADAKQGWLKKTDIELL